MEIALVTPSSAGGVMETLDENRGFRCRGTILDKA